MRPFDFVCGEAQEAVVHGAEWCDVWRNMPDGRASERNLWTL